MVTWRRHDTPSNSRYTVLCQNVFNWYLLLILFWCWTKLNVQPLKYKYDWFTRTVNLNGPEELSKTTVFDDDQYSRDNGTLLRLKASTVQHKSDKRRIAVDNSDGISCEELPIDSTADSSRKTGALNCRQPMIKRMTFWMSSNNYETRLIGPKCQFS